ncbi:unnamed protein product [Ambrosiozyma monospora]|uniref:Unnamed protein product n=1 Tax=Ambrosiozyma monospora TaxID=43982 RepID=A0ACB5SUH7_AMBMO|nr:unnamed protein product [Ambrosiozyma monospora]
MAKLTHFISLLAGVLFMRTRFVNAEDTTKPSVLVYKAGSVGYFEVDVPANLAPFTIKASPDKFNFLSDVWYFSDESSSITTGGTINYVSNEVAYTYNTLSDSNKPETIRVGLGFSAPYSTVDHLRADFTVQPESFGTSYYTIDATLFPETHQTTAALSFPSSSRSAYFAVIGGEIPTSTSVFTPSSITPPTSAQDSEASFFGSTTTTITPAMTSPYVTMAAVAPSAVTFSKISYSAYGSDIKYLTDSAYFEGVRDGTTNRLSDTIKLSGGVVC